MSRRVASVDLSPERFAASPTLAELIGYAPEELTVEEEMSIQPLSYVGMEDETKTQPPLFPFRLSFKNLTYSVKVGQSWKKLSDPVTREKMLLDNISGDAKEGEIMAVLGPSGSGKSTLLDALANRISKGSLKGTVTLNGEKLESSLLKIISAYVMQDDLLHPMLTVEETLMFAAKFRLPRTLSNSKKKKRVDTLIHQLGLNDAAKTVIGDEDHRGVSGGERRRVSIGIGIIHDPIILFLDEPTSGLDSTSAYMVIKVLKRIAQGGSAVVLSIHQPSYRIVSLLDRLLVLSRGQTVYNGSPMSLPLFMSDFGLPVPEDANPIEFALDIVRELEDSPNGNLAMVDFNKSWKRSTGPIKETLRRNSSLKEAVSASISRGKLVSGGKSLEECATTIPSFANPFWTEVAILVKRSFINSRRMPEQLGFRMGIVILTAFILATLFWRLGDSLRGIRERVGFFAYALCIAYYTCGDAVPVFLEERLIFMRETAYNTYRRSSYVISHSLAVIPSLVFQSLVFAAITFWAVGLEGGILGYLFYFFTIFISFWSGTSMVSFLSGALPNLLICYIAVVAITSYFFLACGFYISRTRIQPYWKWLHYVSLPKYTFEALMHNEFQNPNRCYARGVQIFDDTVVSSLPTATKERLLMGLSGLLGMNLTSTTCVTTSDDILKKLDITELSKWNCLLVILAWGFLFRILFYLALLVGSKNNRK